MSYCEENGWRYGFHQVLPDYLKIYKRVGLKSFKIGDCAIVDLIKFNLEGKKGKKLRRTVHKFDREGFTTEYIPPPIRETILEKIKSVSDDWLKIKGRRERTFSLGQFEQSYLSSIPLFVAKNAQAEIFAFANIIPSYCKGEATIDLMRHRKDMPNGTMDYLFIGIHSLFVGACTDVWFSNKRKIIAGRAGRP